MADPVDPLRRRPTTPPHLRGVARSEAADERRRRRTRAETEKPESRPPDSEGEDVDEDADTATHVDLRA